MWRLRIEFGCDNLPDLGLALQLMGKKNFQHFIDDTSIGICICFCYDIILTFEYTLGAYALTVRTFVCLRGKSTLRRGGKTGGQNGKRSFNETVA